MFVDNSVGCHRSQYSLSSRNIKCLVLFTFVSTGRYVLTIAVDVFHRYYTAVVSVLEMSYVGGVLLYKAILLSLLI